MTQAQTEALKPCQFCGGAANWVATEGPDSFGHLTVYHEQGCFYGVRKDVLPLNKTGLEIWNRRAQIEAQAQAAPAQQDAQDAARYRWLAPRLMAADFDWNETGKPALIFEWPRNIAVGGTCDQNIDAAMAAHAKGGEA